MARKDVERRLAAILSADVVVYSTLMAGNEARIFAQLKTHRRKLIEPKAADDRVRGRLGIAGILVLATPTHAVTLGVVESLDLGAYPGEDPGRGAADRIGKDGKGANAIARTSLGIIIISYLP